MATISAESVRRYADAIDDLAYLTQRLREITEGTGAIPAGSPTPTRWAPHVAHEVIESILDMLVRRDGLLAWTYDMIALSGDDWCGAIPEDARWVADDRPESARD